ncbi:hypothetical protein [Vibrio phage CKB-S2]|nr:hypothetical protein [Vibrio phage CKB-S2]
MLKQLVEQRVSNLYRERVEKVRKFAEEQAAEMGLNSYGAKDLLKCALDDGLQYPLVAREALTRQLVESLEVKVGLIPVVNPDLQPDPKDTVLNSQLDTEAIVSDDAVDALVTQEQLDELSTELTGEETKPKLTKTDLKASPIADVRAMCVNWDIDITGPDGKNIGKDDLIVALLDKQEHLSQ